jgi:UDP-N-acetylglucosamine 2-epimerase (non-hydrolysing)
MDSWLHMDSQVILVTGHRRENFGKAFLEVIAALREISELDNVQLVYPVHLNPNVQDPVYDHLGNLKNILLCDPLDYESFLWLIQRCDFIITDSGGIQEEATVLGKNVLVTRNTTERQEAVKAGFVQLVGTDKVKIVKEAISLLEHSTEKIEKENPYGNGDAALKILDAVKTHFIE